MVEHSSVKARFGGHDADYLHPPPCREWQGIIRTDPSAKTFPDLFIPDHRGPSAVLFCQLVQLMSFPLMSQHPPLPGVAGRQRATSILTIHYLSTPEELKPKIRKLSCHCSELRFAKLSCQCSCQWSSFRCCHPTDKYLTVACVESKVQETSMSSRGGRRDYSWLLKKCFECSWSRKK